MSTLEIVISTVVACVWISYIIYKWGLDYNPLSPDDNDDDDESIKEIIKEYKTVKKVTMNKELNEIEFYKYLAKQDSFKSVGLIIQEFIQLKLKEQDKKKYSEEEVIEILTKRCEALGTENKFFQELLLKQDLEWFENYKKKK